MSSLPEKIKKLIAFTIADNDEGRTGDRGDWLHSGHTRDYLTTYGSIDVQEQQSSGEEASKGNITYTFSCRVREKWYEAGMETKTHDYDSPGQISATYVYAFGTLSIGGVTRNGSEGLCGQSISNKLVNFQHNF